MASGSYLVPIYAVLGLLAVDAAISMGFVTSMVSFLHTSGAGPFPVRTTTNSGSPLLLYGKPEHLLTDQGHTTNGAGGTALVLLGLGGILVLWLENRSRQKSGRSHPLFYVWSVCAVLSWLLTITALIYTFVVTAQTAHQSIQLDQLSWPAGGDMAGITLPYAYLQWTPETWYQAVLALDLVEQSDIDLLNRNMRLMVGWRFNLIVLFLLGLALACLVVLENVRLRRTRGQYARAAASLEAKNAGEMTPLA